uniref:Uncharacterized protein n=1 Tax=Arundo donax TaxID=35708 RepID=A0A0A9EZH8_ARUDO
MAILLPAATFQVVYMLLKKIWKALYLQQKDDLKDDDDVCAECCLALVATLSGPVTSLRHLFPCPLGI